MIRATLPGRFDDRAMSLEPYQLGTNIRGSWMTTQAMLAIAKRVFSKYPALFWIV